MHTMNNIKLECTYMFNWSSHLIRSS